MGLLKIRVRPYYLYQCDPVLGTGHLRTTVEKGIEIMAQLRGHTTGYAVPTYVIDAPGGGGKVPIQQDTVTGHADGIWNLRNWQGRTYTLRRRRALMTPADSAPESRPLRIGLCYDLKGDYLAAGFSPEAVMEFDEEETITGLSSALAALGHRPERVGRGLELARRLAAGERWDLVFNFAEGVRGRSREGAGAGPLRDSTTSRTPSRTR